MGETWWFRQKVLARKARFNNPAAVVGVKGGKNGRVLWLAHRKRTRQSTDHEEQHIQREGYSTATARLIKWSRSAQICNER